MRTPTEDYQGQRFQPSMRLGAVESTSISPEADPCGVRDAIFCVCQYVDDHERQGGILASNITAVSNRL